VRILCVTFEAPSKMYGGGLGIIQSLASLSANAEIDYMGPYFDINQFEQIKIATCYYLDEECRVFKKIINLLLGVPVRYYTAWKKQVAQVNIDEYDAVFVDFSYNDFVAKWAKTLGKKTFVRVHNIERDMVLNTIKTGVLNKYWIRAIINGWIIGYREKRTFRIADEIIFLTHEDMMRGCSLYGKDLKEKSTIIPVCLDQPAASVNEDERGNYILATGSLYYGPNAIGIKWFIQNVWRRIQQEGLLQGVTLLVAGRKPDPEMVSLCGETENCMLVNSPESIEPYFKTAKLYVAPIFSGAGMKVKVAEALSYGLHVVGTHHALIGYEEAVDYTSEANDAKAFYDLIIEYMLKGNED